MQRQILLASANSTGIAAEDNPLQSNSKLVFHFLSISLINFGLADTVFVCW